MAAMLGSSHINKLDKLKSNYNVIELKHICYFCRQLIKNEKCYDFYIDNIKINESKILELAYWHGVIPLVYTYIKNNPDDLLWLKILSSKSPIDTNLFDSFKRLYFQNSIKTMGAAGEIIRITREFEESEIRCIQIKGTVLALSTLNDILLRQSGDLDILIEPKDIKNAVQILEQCGYEGLWHNFDISEISDKQLSVLLKNGHHLNFYNSQRKMSLELHFKLTKKETRPSGYFEELWNNSVSVYYNRAKLQSLCLEDNLAYLCEHGAKHMFCKLKWLFDIYVLIEKNKIDWIKIIKIAEDKKNINMLCQAVILCNVLFELDIPREMEHILNSNKKCWALAKSSIEMYKKPPSALNILFETTDSINFHYLYIKRYEFILMGDLRDIKKMFVPDFSDYKTVKLPDSLFFIYYIIHIIKIILPLKKNLIIIM